MNKRLLKALVVTFSFSAGALLVWQLKRNLAGEPQVSSEQGEVVEEQESDVSAFAISPKSAGGSLRFFEEESEEGGLAKEQPLMSGSKFMPLHALEEDYVKIPGIPLSKPEEEQNSEE